MLGVTQRKRNFMDLFVRALRGCSRSLHPQLRDERIRFIRLKTSLVNPHWKQRRWLMLASIIYFDPFPVWQRFSVLLPFRVFLGLFDGIETIAVCAPFFQEDKIGAIENLRKIASNSLYLDNNKDNANSQLVQHMVLPGLTRQRLKLYEA